MQDQRQRAAALKEKGNLTHLFGLTDLRTQKQTSIFGGNECFRLFGDIKQTLPPDQFRMEFMYLAGVGLRPIDPQPGVETRKTQQQFWFPKNFDLYSKCRILPIEEIIDGTPCIVVESDWKRMSMKDVDVHVIDRIWFDPAVGFAPRKWKQRVNESLESVRTNSDFEEMAPGCWLPWESTWTFFPPVWASEEYRDLPAYRFNIRLRKAHLNRVDADYYRSRSPE
jgi:hypothetical protein